MIHIELFDDCDFHWNEVLLPTRDRVVGDNLDNWFSKWALNWRKEDSPQKQGMFLIHANALLTGSGSRQELQGIELLKHIRLTPSIGKAQSWHAIVYSFESAEDILSRNPGDLIVKSPGVTFLRLPCCTNLRLALANLYRMREWNEETDWDEILQYLAGRSPAVPNDLSFRPYVAADYRPPDSAHRVSNLWGIYEVWQALSRVDATPPVLPKPIREFVLRLDTKKAHWLEGARLPVDHSEKTVQDCNAALIRLRSGKGTKNIVYVDDEAQKGWHELLTGILNRDPEKPTLNIKVPSSEQLQLPAWEERPEEYELRLKELSGWILQQDPALLILDLRLLGSQESNQNPNQSSGMNLAREVRRSNRCLPILLFTASNKAETILISRSLDIDSYWMKPGLGEHRGSRSREEDLSDLTDRLNTLLGEDYSWLLRVDRQINILREKNDEYWWEQEITWHRIEAGGIQTQIEKQSAQADIRSKVLWYLDFLLSSAHLICKLRDQLDYQNMDGEADVEDEDPKAHTEKSWTERLCSGLFNQIGQVVELVHHDKSALIGGQKKKAAGRVGGASSYEFRRCDWWGFRLFAMRNRYSHPGGFARFSDVKGAMSDLIAWLSCSRVEGQLIDEEGRRKIAERMHSSARGGQKPFPILRLHEGEEEVGVSVNGEVVPCSPPNGGLALNYLYRQQLGMRPEFKRIAEESKKILRGG